MVPTLEAVLRTSISYPEIESDITVRKQVLNLHTYKQELLLLYTFSESIILAQIHRHVG